MLSPTAAERAASLPGDELLPDADVVMDRAVDLPAPPVEVWPWLVQLGKRRAGWYLPRSVERWLPPSRRASRRLEPRWQGLAVGEVIPDWGGRDATFTVAELAAPHHLVHTSRRGRVGVVWALVLREQPGGSRLHLRLRLGPVRRRRLATYGGGAVDWLTVAGLARGLRERVTTSRQGVSLTSWWMPASPTRALARRRSAPRLGVFAATATPPARDVGVVRRRRELGDMP